MSELDNIITRYEKRESGKMQFSKSGNLVFEMYRNYEREEKYKQIILKYYKNLSEIKVLEIGAGDGTNICFFKNTGILPSNIWANELLKNRAEILRKNHPDISILNCDARELEFKNKFDIILQSMVFSSILDSDFRHELANKLLQLIKNEGIILWYDFIYNNPWNKDVRGIRLEEVRKLFPSTYQEYHRLTLLPQLARRTGKWYPYINRMAPFLRTHVLISIQKKRNS